MCLERERGKLRVSDPARFLGWETMLRECHSTGEYRIDPRHLRELEVYLARVPPDQVQEMRDQINLEADRTGRSSNDYFASAWGKHWTGRSRVAGSIPTAPTNHPFSQQQLRDLSRRQEAAIRTEPHGWHRTLG